MSATFLTINNFCHSTNHRIKWTNEDELLKRYQSESAIHDFVNFYLR